MASTSVTQINLSRSAFDLIALANYTISVRDQKQQSFQQVMAAMLDAPLEITADRIASFEAYMPIGGNTRVYVRLNASQQVKVDQITARAAAYSSQLWQRRETLVFLCFALTQKFS